MIGAASGLVALPACVFAFASLFLLAGGELGAISAWAILAASALAALVISYRTGGWLSPLIIVIVVSIAAVASHFLIDTSWDGQRYQYDATRALAEGWNPYREAFPTPAGLYSEQWPQFYPMAAWLASAVPVAAGLDIEAAKLPQLLLAIALFVGALGASTTFGLNRWQSLAVAVCAALNPIIVVQAFTRMNDGLLASCIGICAIFAALWLRDRRFDFLAIALAAMAFGLNLKFSAIPTFVILCSLIVALAWYALGRGAAIRASAALLAGGIVGICLLGAHPYVTNTLEHHHPFYPVYGDNPVDIITMNRPRAFADLTEVERLASSYFGPSSNAVFRAEGELKWPFTLHADEFDAAGAFDARMGGFGPFFSGAMIVAMLLCLWIGIADRTKSRLVALGAIVALAVASLAMPEAWWARYVPQLWWTPLLVAIVAFASTQLSVRLAGWALVAILSANTAFVTASSAQRVANNSTQVRQQIAAIAAQDEPICVQISQSHARLQLLRSAGVEVVVGPLEGRQPRPLVVAGINNDPSYAPCSEDPSAVPDAFTLTLDEPTDLIPPDGSPIRISTLNGALRLQGYVPNASSQLKTDGAAVRVDAFHERAFAGRRVRVSFHARGTDGAAAFTAAYSTNGNGNSGWQTLAVTSEFAETSFEYAVPTGVFAGNDFVGIVPRRPARLRFSPCA